ncbi:uncharacterized protein TEOVI_000137800 [Trypanosoma equiperdum]|uniref:Uncharacterized protein n=2 Tax=Trypanozoon TaxID=39700 RepID=Q389D7_TRYB2|nr:hypothetical protein, conserved [Trypanosoma brucei brucei TREU927]EAN78583.1 hypothetical protein, conserved [Trypanosoma brucei brucei TREU927]SCU69809.1 hypothetical protein, conserved [Trypanosoma equiperdum]
MVLPRKLVGQCCLLLQKKQTAASYMANAGKVGSEEKWAQAAMEYLHEKRHCNDSRKRQHDVDNERRMAFAFDRYCSVNEKIFTERLSRLSDRMTEALETIKQLGMDHALEEALMLSSEQPPLNFRRPTLTPPVAGYEPGFGLDVPQLRSRQAEYPPVGRPTDAMEFGEEKDPSFPLVESFRVEDLTTQCLNELEERHGEIREAAPTTGVEGEAWEAYVALQKKALARQQLIFELCNDGELRERYDSDVAFRQRVWEERGMLPLEIERERLHEEPRHYAQEPAYHPFRKM